MSAQKLEDFIRVIETAERASSSPTSTILFQDHSDLAAVKPPHPDVPRLWRAQADGEFLGSSWGSTGSTAASLGGRESSAQPWAGTATTEKTFITTSSSTVASPLKSSGATGLQTPSLGPKTIASNVTVPSTPSSKVMSAKTRGAIGSYTSSPGSKIIQTASSATEPSTASSKVISAKSSGASGSGSRQSADIGPPLKEPLLRNPLVDLQKLEGRHGRIHSTDLSPASSPSVARKKPVIIKKDSGNTSSSSKSSIEEPTCLERPPSPPRSPPPRPRSRITIRQSSVRMHVHPKHEEKPERKPLEQKKEPPKKPLKKAPQSKLILKPEQTKKRPQSAPPPKAKPKKRIIIRKKKEIPEPQVDLKDFSKSLQLLGFQIAPKKETVKVDNVVGSISGQLRTRLNQRSFSMTNLAEVIDSNETLPKSKFVEIRKDLSKAVYQEWYFKKLEVERARKRAEAAEAEERDYEREQREEMAGQNFKEWLEKKRKLNAPMPKDTTEDQEKRDRIKKAEKEWMEKKRKESVEQKKEEEKRMAEKEKEMEEKEQENERKKVDAEKAFTKWKDLKEEDIKKKLKEQKTVQKQRDEEHQREEEEKRRNADKFHASWVREKDRILAQRKETQARQGGSEKEERLKAVSEAYEKWLDEIEEREQFQQLEADENAWREIWRPPWYPVG